MCIDAYSADPRMLTYPKILTLKLSSICFRVLVCVKHGNTRVDTHYTNMFRVARFSSM